MPLAQISEKRLAANRANARKSTGPRTAQGKAKVSANARRTGIYSEDHRMPPRIEAHFRALAEARTQGLADPTLRGLTYEWHMLQGHLALHDSRERALFNAGLEYGRGNEQIAREWVLRQHGYIQALNRYAGWIQMRVRRVETAILATPAGLDHLTQLVGPEPEQPPSPAHGGQHSRGEGLEPRRTGNPETAASSSPVPRPANDQPGPAEPATTEPTAIFAGTNPPAPEPPPAQRVSLEPKPKLEPKQEFEGTNPPAVQRPTIPPVTLEPTMEFEGTNPLPGDRPAPPMASPTAKESSLPPRTQNQPEATNPTALRAADPPALSRDRQGAEEPPKAPTSPPTPRDPTVPRGAPLPPKLAHPRAEPRLKGAGEQPQVSSQSPKPPLHN